MTLRYVTDAEQIAAIDQAVADGWRVVRVDVEIGNPKLGHGIFAAVHFARQVNTAHASPFNEGYFVGGFESVTQEFGCGLEAARHARDLMGKTS